MEAAAPILRTCDGTTLGKTILLSANPDGTGDVRVDDGVQLRINGTEVLSYDFSNHNSGVVPHMPRLMLQLR